MRDDTTTQDDNRYKGGYVDAKGSEMRQVLGKKWSKAANKGKKGQKIASKAIARSNSAKAKHKKEKQQQQSTNTRNDKRTKVKRGSGEAHATKEARRGAGEQGRGGERRNACQ